jgi:hypothetical protein
VRCDFDDGDAVWRYDDEDGNRQYLCDDCAASIDLAALDEIGSIEVPF